MARTDPQLNFRIPADLKDRLEAAAAKNKRTLTAELVARLESSFHFVPEGMILPSDFMKRVAELEQDMARLKLAAMIDQK